MIIRNDASSVISLVRLLEDRRRVTDVPSMLKFTKSYDAFIALMAEKRIYIYKIN
ncbi:hypothetical protein J2X69_003329 [Algoriphagus sp. 4150]|uniref:hypothetical protein n=1 Tax=Algoriphagus sp. 4150 TaxID=2817756 RepID=UPI00285469CA|nr:hypothetical protein [Algoriphagus sp. 4150]MDR7130970.1 hypothetical protein [Algoriphagus sp. 4150]